MPRPVRGSHPHARGPWTPTFLMGVDISLPWGVGDQARGLAGGLLLSLAMQVSCSRTEGEVHTPHGELS